MNQKTGIMILSVGVACGGIAGYTSSKRINTLESSVSTLQDCVLTLQSEAISSMKREARRDSATLALADKQYSLDCTIVSKITELYKRINQQQ